MLERQRCEQQQEEERYYQEQQYYEQQQQEEQQMQEPPAEEIRSEAEQPLTQQGVPETQNTTELPF
jgi:hypothetical protein